jgi:hypothetical protein
MTDKKRSDVEVIEAYRKQARSRRLSSALVVAAPKSGSVEVIARQKLLRYDHTFTRPTTEGVIQSKDGKVTVTMKGAKPISKSAVTQFFGQSSVSIPEYRSIKDSILESASPELGDTSAGKKSRKPSK